jgi:hypothetical protein
MNDMQAMVNGMSANWQRERAESQMTLGNVIEFLESVPDDLKISGLGELDSYRGYYSDLAFAPDEASRTSGDILAECNKAMGKVFTGYKGGDYVMGELTPLWVASYGCCGKKLILINPDGTLETAEDDD